MWMHNGYISQFTRIRRRILDSLRDELFLSITGNTDSEHIFALFLNQFTKPLDSNFTYEEIRENMLATIKLINDYSRQAGITEVKERQKKKEKKKRKKKRKKEKKKKRKKEKKKKRKKEKKKKRKREKKKKDFYFKN